jgi:hypothetical protein
MNYKQSFIVVIGICLLSCNSNKNPSPTDLNYFDIDDIETAFPLPYGYRPIGDEELESESEQQSAPIKDFLSFKDSESVAYFKQDQYPYRQVAIFSSKEIIPVERVFSNSFVRTVEHNIYQNTSLFLYYEILQNKFLKIKNRKAFKLKIRSMKEKKDTIYSTYYLVSTKTESLIINETSQSEEDLQDVIATFMIKSR